MKAHDRDGRLRCQGHSWRWWGNNRQYLTGNELILNERKKKKERAMYGVTADCYLKYLLQITGYGGSMVRVIYVHYIQKMWTKYRYGGYVVIYEGMPRKVATKLG
jgi:hypothetical protein